MKKKKVENGSTRPDRAYEVKEMNSPSRKSLSETVLHHTLPSYTGDCHPSSRLSFLRLLYTQRHEAGRMGAIATSDGWDLEGGRELKNEGRKRRSLGARKQSEGT
jgi:hypothetical protein